MALKTKQLVNKNYKEYTDGQRLCGLKHLTIQEVQNTTTLMVQKADQSKALRGNYAGIGYSYDEDNNIFWPKQPFTSWVKHNASASWKSPIGDAPALTEEQTSQNEANTHRWTYSWSEDAYNADNTQGWVLANTLA
jgi:hypothetical protein